MNHCKAGRRRSHGARASRDAIARTVLRALPGLVLLVVLAAVAGPVRMLAAEAATERHNDAYRFGVFPYLPTAKIDRIFGPAALDLARALGAEVQLRTRSTFEHFADELADENYDIIFVHPFFYVEAHDQYRYLPLASLDEPLVGVAMVADDSPLQQASDLRGQTVALPPPLAAVSRLATAAMIDAGLEPARDVTLRHYHDKASCLQAVAIGAAAACVVPSFVLNQLSAPEDMRLRPLFETPAISPAVFAVHERVPEVHRRALRARIIGWPDTAAGRRIMAAGAWTGFRAVSDEDYDGVRRYRARLRAVGGGLRPAHG